MRRALAPTLFKGGGVGIDPARLFANGESGDYWEAFDLAGTLDATVQTLSGKRGVHNLAQATSGNRPLLKARADAIRYLDFASAKSMSVASSTALFKYLHDGTGGTLLAFIDWPQSEVSSDFIRNASGSAAAGIILSKVSANQRMSPAIERASAGTHTITTSLQGLPVGGVERPTFYRQSYKNDGGANDFIASFNASVTRYELATGNAPSTANAGSDFTIHSTFGGKLYALLVINRKLTEAEVAGVYAWWARRKGVLPAIAAPALTLLVGGQSNASGRGTLVTAPVPVAGVSVLDKAGEYRLIYEPSHSLINQPVATSPTEPTLYSPAVSFLTVAGNALKEDGAVNSLWVPCAIGSTSIADWDDPTDVGDITTLFGSAVYRMKQAIAEKGGTPVIVWYGHETSASLAVGDYVAGGVGSVYQTQWTDLITHLRAELGASVPVIFVQLSATDVLAGSVQQALAGEAQRQTELTVANSYMVVSHDVLRNASTDDQHLATAGLATLGERIALAIREHVLEEAVNGTGPRIVGATWAGGTVTLDCDKAVNTTAGNYGNLFRVYDNGVEATVSSANRNGSDTSKIDIVCSASLSGPVTLTYGHRAGAASAARTDFVADSDGLPLPVFGPLLATA